ncbi:hypothetical protein QMK17_07960 [Rhodococcus sp. G-MC3]|uniref:hypothetical protein n=1 Tax=Rhodococcus sp. G-MC3 TaxID=3046209 RepID=UPI0024BA395B|nr:hypothetical protein [Rhodococcus sp. G-MC3]MDJ0393264.1 hypothetical protein [Rhodococcus sp. G-MC3]
MVGTTPTAAVPPTTAASASSSDSRREVRRLLRSTPALMIFLGFLLMVASILTGLVASGAVSDREDTLDTLLVRTEPLANSAQNLYGALSVADAAASTAFIAGGLEPQEVRDRYAQAIGDAGTELIRASAGLGESDDDARAALSEIGAGLPVYTGLVETARSNNRLGNPVGSSYLGEASALMQTSLLPRAEGLYTDQASRVSTDQEPYVRPPVLAIVLIVAFLMFIVLAQVFLSRRTHRTFNWGFLGAAAMVTMLLGWMLVAGFISATSTDRALNRGVAPLQTLTTGFILAQQARSDETLNLVRRGSMREYDAEFSVNTRDLMQLFDGEDKMIDALTKWQSAHARSTGALTTGDFNTAVTVATGSGVADSAAQFRALDDMLADGITQARTELRGNISRGKTALVGLSSGAVILTVAASAAIGAGLLPRLREYL